jgi:hypothetical protein
MSEIKDITDNVESPKVENSNNSFKLESEIKNDSNKNIVDADASEPPLEPAEFETEYKDNFPTQWQQVTHNDMSLSEVQSIQSPDYLREANKADGLANGLRQDVVDDPRCFNQATGELQYDNGLGSTESTSIDPNMIGDHGEIKDSIETHTLQPGDKLVRYGTPDGEYFAPEGTDYEQMALPYDKEKVTVSHYEVTKPFDVEQSTIAPNHHQDGGGTQYKLNDSAQPVTDYNREHVADEIFTEGKVESNLNKDSPSNLMYEDYIKKVE